MERVESRRLKRARRSEPDEKTGANVTDAQTHPEAASEVLSSRHRERLRDLGLLVTDFLANGKTNGVGRSDNLQQIVAISADLLANLSIDVIFEHVPNLSRALIQAAKLSSCVNPPDVVSCFLYMALKKSNVENEVEQGNMEENVSNRASKWALPILSKLVKWSPPTSLHDHVFIEPWYKVHQVELSAQVEYMIFALSQYRSMPGRKFDQIIDELVHPILRLLNEPDGNIYCSPTFQRLSLNARADLLYLSQQIYSVYLTDLRRIFSSRDVDMTAVEKYTQPLSRACEKHATIHWKLMDHVCQAVHADGEPFSVNVWKDRLWTRCVLINVSLQLGDDIAWRIHPKLRTYVKQMRVLQDCFYKVGNIEAGVTLARLLHKWLKLDQRATISVLWQATLIVLEEMVECAVWACGRHQRQSDVTAKSSSRVQLADICSAIISAMQTLRLKDGQCVYSDDVIMKSRKNMCDVLFTIWNGRNVKNSKPENCVSSLFVIALIAAKDTDQAKECMARLYGRRSSEDMLKHEVSWAVRASERIETRFSRHRCDGN